MKRIFLIIILGFSVSTLCAQQILTLERALEIASINSPSIQNSLLSLERSQESLNAQKAALKSRFSLRVDPVSYRQTRSFDEFNSSWYTNKSYGSNGTFNVEQPLLFSGGNIALRNQFGWQYSKNDASGREDKAFVNNLNLNLTQPLFTHNVQKLQLRELELDLENTQISYALQMLNLERQVTDLFYRVFMAQSNLSIAEDEQKNTEKSYEITKNKVDAGLLAKEELYQADLNFANSRSGLQNQRVSLENLKDQFKQYIGMDLDEEFSIMMPNIENTAEFEINLQKAIDHALISRMELRQREISIENAQFTMLTVKARNEFRGDVTLSVGLTGQHEKLGNIFESPTSSPSVGISFNVPLFDWGERKSRIKAQEAVIKQQNLSFDNEKVQIEIDIRGLHRSLSNLKNQIEIAQQSEKNAQLTYEINLERYANGDLTGMELNLYQTQLSERKMAYSQSLINYKTELLNLKIQSLFDFEKNIPIIPEKIINK